MRLHWNGCGLILHELCHLIHQLALPQGLDNDQVKKAYGLAKVTGLYDTIRRRDWVGKAQDFDLAYAMVWYEWFDRERNCFCTSNNLIALTTVAFTSLQVDCKEFFAEMSVAYWSQGYDELDTQDRNRIILCSPPFMEPNVLSRLRKKGIIDVDHHRQKKKRNCFFQFPFPLAEKKHPPSHCNKFYPFTRGQLKYHDPDTFRTIESLWQEVSDWEDPWHNEAEDGLCRRAPGCFLFPLCSRRKPSGFVASLETA